MTEPEFVYCDGGLIGPNPSPVGGTWAWVWVHGGIQGRSASGIITPSDFEMPTISNNHTELLAAVRALESTPKGWTGTLCSDSQVTLHRLSQGTTFNNVPRWLVDRTLQATRSRRCKVKLMAGHPTKIELQQGFRERNQLPTSKWNCWCDIECRRLAAKFRGTLK